MAFKPADTAKVCEIQEGDTLQSIVQRETAAGNPLSWQELAHFNWGTDDPDEVNNFMRDHLGARRRGADENFTLSPDDTVSSDLLIPERFEQTGFSTGQTHTIRLRRKSSPVQFRECCHVPGVTFGFDSSFLRPTVVSYLKKLELVIKRHPDGKILVFGHSDAAGDELYNKKLSERRAWSVYAFVTNNAADWEALYNHPDEDWGLQVVQEILADLGHDPGPIDGVMGDKTQAAMRDFRSLPDGVSVSNDAAFRLQLFEAYMTRTHDVDLAPDQFLDPGYMGCGEFNPVETGADRLEENRRVSFILFHPDRLPTLPCAFADCEPCRHQNVTPEHHHRRSYQCSFYDSLFKKCDTTIPTSVDWISFSLMRREDQLPVKDARYSLQLPNGTTIQGTLDENGKAHVDTDQPGSCILRFHDFHAADWDALEDADIDMPALEGDFDEDDTDEEPELEISNIGDSPFFDDDPDGDFPEETDIIEP